MSSSVVTMNCLDVDALTNNTSIEEEGKKEFHNYPRLIKFV